ncbi:hypothetical protein Tco_0729990 [Tanacetum coccineum]|uniref:Uncharacterized protein n=1 Tax=Tanacetum coccineum TaxID=301880 RepID=A0ABQ4YQH2_9ASTR
METIHFKFDELTAMASECNNSGPGLNCLNFQDSSDGMNEIPSQQDLDNLFSPLNEEYYAPSTFEVSNNSAANTLDVEEKSVEIEFPAIVFNDNLTSNETLSCEPTVSSLNDNEIDFRISFDESDDEDYTVVYDENSFSYKIISVNNLKTHSENDNEKVNMPSFPSPKPEVSYFNDLDFFKDFKNEFPVIVYNDALTSKSDLLTEPTISPRHIDEFDLKDETSLSECDEKEQNVLYFNDLLPFNVIYSDDLKSDTDNDNDKIDIELPSGDMSVIPLPNEPSERNDNVGGVFINLEILNCWSLEIPRRLFNTLFAHELNLENHS